MSGYPKIWTSILDQDWFQSLPCLSRGLYLQLILLAKRAGDTGEFSVKSYSWLANQTGCDDSTAAKNLRKLQEIPLIDMQDGKFGGFVITVLNYQYWQSLKSYKDHKQIGEKSAKNRLQLRPLRSKNRAEEGATATPILGEGNENITFDEFRSTETGQSIFQSYLDTYSDGTIRNEIVKLRNWLKGHTEHSRHDLQGWSNLVGRWFVEKENIES